MFDPSRMEPAPRRREPIFRIPPATLVLALVLVAVYLLLRLLSEGEETALLLRFGFQPDLFLAALEGRAPLAPAAWPLATHLLLHYDGLHLVTNVGFLLAFASVVERRLGWPAFLAIFLACGVVGALFQTWLVFDEASRAALLVGASGGIFGLMGVALLLGAGGPRMAAGRVIVVLMVLNVAIGLASEFGLVGGYLIGWQAHAGGFLLGLLIGWLLRRRYGAG